MTSLRQRMIEDLRIRNYSPKTVDVYVRCVAKFARHFGKSPEDLGPNQVRDYQKHLVDQKVSWAHFNQTVCALRFLYKTTLNRGWMIEHIPFPKHEKRLPVVLSPEELATFFCAIENLKHRTVLQTMYGAGLRITEALGLETHDVDSNRKLLRIRQGKGKIDRYVPLSMTLLEILRTYWKAYRPQSWLFPGKTPERPMHATGIQKICKLTGLKAGLSKPVKTHTMRHCFATHLLEAGVDLKKIQYFLGHGSLSTTGMYLHVAHGALQSAEGLDLLGAVQEVPAPA